MVGRRRPGSVAPLLDGERFVHDDTARDDGFADRREQIALQVPGDHDEIEAAARQRMLGEIRAPPVDVEPFGPRAGDRLAHRVEPPIDAEHAVPRACQDKGVAAPPHREVQRPLRSRRAQPLDPLGGEPGGYNGAVVAQALLSAVGIGLVGLAASAVFGLRGTDIARHISFGIFATMVTLLAHSMMMFYLIGKGKAVKDAMAENNLTGDYYRRIAVARKPVFSIGTLAMAVTIVTAILGASVDTGVMPPVVHGMIAYGAIACNLAAAKIEIDALAESSRIVDEVNRLILQRGS